MAGRLDEDPSAVPTRGEDVLPPGARQCFACGVDGPR